MGGSKEHSKWQVIDFCLQYFSFLRLSNQLIKYLFFGKITRAWYGKFIALNQENWSCSSAIIRQKIIWKWREIDFGLAVERPFFICHTVNQLVYYNYFKRALYGKFQLIFFNASALNVIVCLKKRSF